MDQTPVFFDISKNTFTYFKEDVFKIGRSSACDLEIPSTFVSRLQCIIEKEQDGAWVIEDKSTFGNTLVNSRKVNGRLPLKDGDTVSFLNCADVKGLMFYHQHPEAFTPRKKRRREEGLLEPSIIEEDSESAGALATQPRRVELHGEGSGAIGPPANMTYRTVISAYEEENRKLTKTVEELTKEIKFLKEKSSRLEPVPKLNSSSVVEIDDTPVDPHEDDDSWVINFESFDNGPLLNCESSSQMEVVKPASNSDLSEPINQTSETGTVQPSGPKVGALCDNYSSEVDRVELVMLREKVTELSQELSLKDEVIAKENQERSNFRNCVIETLENYLMCGICNDIIYQAVTIPCKHTFCSACLNEWKKSKKECPICRTKFKTEVSTLMLDSFAEKLIDVIGGDVKSRRQEVIKDREKPLPRPSPRHTRTPTGRGGRHQRRRQPQVNPFGFQYLLGGNPNVVIERLDSYLGAVIDLTTPERR